MIGGIGVMCFLFGAMGIESESVGLPILLALVGTGLMYVEVLIEAKKNHRRNHSHDASYPSCLR